MRGGLLTLALILLIVRLTPLAQPAAEADLSGVYYCEGLNGDGSPYRAVVVIRKHNDTYRLHWNFSSRAAAFGLGIRNEDTLAVSYYGANTGVVLYNIVGEHLVGRWTVAGGNGGVATERLTRVGEVPPGTDADPAGEEAPPVTPAPQDTDEADDEPSIRV
jgi:hypothetical protein